MSNELSIGPASLADAEAILALQYLCYESEARLYDDWSIPPLTQTLEDLRGEFATGIVLKACAGRALIGSVRANLDRHTCRIGRLIVHPSQQRRGVGTRLMSEIERAFPNARRYELFTGSRSEGNLRLYESLGYRRCRADDVSPNVTLVFLEKINERTIFER